MTNLQIKIFRRYLSQEAKNFPKEQSRCIHFGSKALATLPPQNRFRKVNSKLLNHARYIQNSSTTLSPASLAPLYQRESEEDRSCDNNIIIDGDIVTFSSATLQSLIDEEISAFNELKKDRTTSKQFMKEKTQKSIPSISELLQHFDPQILLSRTNHLNKFSYG